MTLKNIPANVFSPSPPAPVAPAPELLWPSVDYSTNASGYCEHDFSEFPDAHRIRWRYQLIVGSKGTLGLEVLRNAMRSASIRILILDLYFAQYGYPFLENAAHVTSATDIRIISKLATGAKQSDVKKKTQKLEFLRNPKPRDGRPPGKLEWKARLEDAKFPHLHDRFAIVDNYLWHFGATVGGGHPRLNAVSYGWSASATRALEFFEEVWRTP
jgi:hypothetical protein